VEDSSVFPESLKQEISVVVSKPFDSADASSLATDMADLPADQQAELTEIFEKGTLRGFQGAIIVGGLVALFGAVMAVRLPNKKLESDGGVEKTVEEIVRNSTIPRVQLEMTDLERSSKQ